LQQFWKLIFAIRTTAPPSSDAAEEVFDFVSSPVEALGAIGFLGSGAAVWDDRQAPSSLICWRTFLLS
jgi:hypothetical protein